jgi:hypothetical protein
MITSIAIYIEGGGDTAQTLIPFRSGMSAFLRPVVDQVRLKHVQWRVIPCGGRRFAYEAFVDALEKEPEVFNVLLVDSEEPLVISVPPWRHLKEREGDKWEKPEQADDARCQMMVACMEAWFLADPAGLKEHFGGNFDSGKLPPADQAETRTKSEIHNALKRATKNTKAKEYRKIRDGAKLLQTVERAEVRKHCKWCDRLFRTLGDAIGVDV